MFYRILNMTMVFITNENQKAETAKSYLVPHQTPTIKFFPKIAKS